MIMVENAPGHQTPLTYLGRARPSSLSKAFTNPPAAPDTTINPQHRSMDAWSILLIFNGVIPRFAVSRLLQIFRTAEREATLCQPAKQLHFRLETA